MFSFALRSKDSLISSYVDYGYYDTDAIINQDDLTWINVQSYERINQFYWAADITGIRLRT